MRDFLSNLRQGGPAFSVEDLGHGDFLMHRVEGRESGFNDLARLVMEKSGDAYSAFPRSDGNGGYDCVHIIAHEA